MEKLDLNLRLFDGSGDGGSSASGTAEVGLMGGTEQPAETPEKGAPAKRGKNALANVQYGKQAAPEAGGEGAAPAREPETQVTADTAEQRRAAFEELIKGEYKDVFHERTQQIINARFKEAKQLETRLQAMQPMLDALSSKYGVDASDAEALLKAIGEDDSYFEEEADRRGMTVEQLKAFRKTEAENAQLRRALEERERLENRDRVFQRWEQESAQCAQVYEGFDLHRELQSPETGERFLGMLRSGVDVKTAYEVVHKDELMGGALPLRICARRL